MVYSHVIRTTEGSMSDEQINTEIEKGLADLASGIITSAETVAERMRNYFELPQSTRTIIGIDSDPFRSSSLFE